MRILGRRFMLWAASAAFVLAILLPCTPALALGEHVLSGTIRDNAGNPIAGSQICVNTTAPYYGPCVSSDETGHYSISTAEGQNYLFIMNGVSARTPRQLWDIDTYVFDIHEDSVADITVRFHKLLVHVQDPFGAPIPNALVRDAANGERATPPAISFSNPNLSFSPGGASYDHTYDYATTNSNGDAELYTVSNMFSVVTLYYNTGYVDMGGGVGTLRQENDESLVINAQYPGIQNLVGADTTTVPSLSWDAITGADHYDVYRSVSPAGTSLPQASRVATTTAPSLTDSGASAEGLYYYWIAALDGNNHMLALSNQPLGIGVDRTPPEVVNLSVSPNPVSASAVTTLSFQTLDRAGRDSTAEYFIGSDPGMHQATPVPYLGRDDTTGFILASVVVTAPATAGEYPVTVRAFDGIGNVTQQTVILHVNAAQSHSAKTQGNTQIVPVYGSDILPGLTSAGQSDKARFDFDLAANLSGAITVKKPLHLTYDAGSHQLDIVATATSWLTVGGSNNSIAVFDGTAQVTLDGQLTSLPFRATATDGGRLSPTSADRFQMILFGDPSRTTVLYKVDQSLNKGKISLQ